MPGCERLEAIGEHRFRGDVMLGAGPVKGLFDVRIDLTDLDRPNRVHLAGSATGALGSSRGSGRLHLEPMGDSATLIRYRYAIRLSGKVAAVGGRLLRGAARQLIGRFMHALARQAVGGGRADDAAPASGNGLSLRDAGVPPAVGGGTADVVVSAPRTRARFRRPDGGAADDAVPLREAGRAASPRRGDAGADDAAPARPGRNTPARNTLWHRIAALFGGRR